MAHEADTKASNRRPLQAIAVVLALAESGLITAAIWFTAHMSPPMAFAVGEPLYLLVPAVVGLVLAYRRQATISEGAQAGMLIGGVTSIVVSVGFGVALGAVLAHNLIWPPAPTASGWYKYSRTLDEIATVVVWVVICACNAIGAGLSVLGGALGAAIGRGLGSWNRRGGVDQGSSPA